MGYKFRVETELGSLGFEACRLPESKQVHTTLAQWRDEVYESGLKHGNLDVVSPSHGPWTEWPELQGAVCDDRGSTFKVARAFLRRNASGTVDIRLVDAWNHMVQYSGCYPTRVEDDAKGSGDTLVEEIELHTEWEKP